MKHKNSARMAVLAAAALGIATLTASTSVAADPSPAGAGPVAKADDLSSKARVAAHPRRTAGAQAAGRAAYFVRFKGAGAADLAKKAGAGSRGSAAAKSRRAEVSRIASGVLSAARGADGKAASIFTVSNAIPGAGLFLDAAGVRAVAANPNVVSVAPMVAKTAEMQSVDSLIKAVNVWKFSGNTGKGVTIGIVDTGVDYTHADFGGRGTIAAFDAADAKDTSPTWYKELPKKAKKKFAGGYDFSGDDYNGDPEPGDGTSPIPQPDNNPLDCNGHGSHVAGISAGYGVSKSGKTLKAKKYRKLTKKKLMKLDIGPGVAPLAKLYALRVFGCEGSTYLDIAAYDRALDPNGDGKFSDHLDIINASLGSDYGPQDDPGTAVINEIASHGVLPALSIGNNGDLTDTGGAPGNATASIASASSVDRLELLDGIKVNAPASVAGIKPGQMSVAYDWLREPPVTGTVATLTEADNLDGCDPLSPADAARVNGKVAFLEWDDNDATRECGSVGRSGNVKAAGAIGAIFTSELEVFAAGITGDEDIPVFQLTNTGSDQLRPFAQNMTLNVTFDGALQASVQRVTPSAVDTISDFTSRGPRGSLPGTVVKPDVAAPGQSIGSAGVGSGNRVSVLSGTSMASPATAGIAALVKAEHPKWSPLKVKAAIMNTARHDLYTGPGRTGEKYGPARVGAGRVNAKGAVTTKLLAWTKGPNNPVSAGFGVVEAPINGGTVTRTKTVKVKNLNDKTVDVKVKYEGIVSQPGVSYSVKPKKLTIEEGKTKKFKVKMTVVPAQLRHTIDPTMEVDQLGVPRQYVSDASGRLLVKQKGKKANRVPVYGAAKPTSATSTSLSGNNLVVSGQGFNTGTGPTDWRSFLSVTEFGGSDEVMPTCAAGEDPASGCAATHTDRGSDIQHVGAGANDDYLWLAMSTHTDWTNLLLNSPDFLLNTDLDPAYEYETFVTIAEATDVYLAVTIDYVTGDTVDIQPINFNWGDVDTNPFDTNVVLLPVSKAEIGLDGPGSHPIEYDPANWNGVLGEYTDFGPIVEFDAGTPDISTAEPLYLDQGGTTIPLTGARDTTKQALIVHLHGAEGRRTELVTVPAIP